MRSRSRLVFVHSSDEMYGADRILLDIYAALTPSERAHAEFWLPTDLPHGTQPLCVQLDERGAVVRHVDLPVLRRAYRTPVGLLHTLGRAVRTSLHLRAARPRLVYLTTSATLLCAPLARALRTPKVVGHKQEIWTRSDARVLGLLARACHRLIAISDPVHANLPTALRARTEVVLNATPEPSSYQPLDGRTGPLTFMVASRWNTWKGHRTLLTAWETAGSPGKLIILGGPPMSGESVDVPSMVAQLTKPSSVTVVGQVSDIGAYIESTDVVVVPSDEPEPFGLVAIEAFARGRPVIGSAAGGLGDIITPSIDGWTFPPGDVAALARLLAGLEREEVIAAGTNARRKYEERFTSDRYRTTWRAAVGHLASG